MTLIGNILPVYPVFELNVYGNEPKAFVYLMFIILWKSLTVLIACIIYDLILLLYFVNKERDINNLNDDIRKGFICLAWG